MSLRLRVRLDFDTSLLEARLEAEPDRALEEAIQPLNFDENCGKRCRPDDGEHGSDDDDFR